MGYCKVNVCIAVLTDHSIFPNKWLMFWQYFVFDICLCVHMFNYWPKNQRLLLQPLSTLKNLCQKVCLVIHTWFNALLPCCSSFHTVFDTVVEFTTLECKEKSYLHNTVLEFIKAQKADRCSFWPFWYRTCWAVSLGRCVSRDTAPLSWGSKSCWWASRTTSVRKLCQYCCARLYSHHKPEIILELV